MQNTHRGTIALDGDTASGRAYMSELGRTRDGRQGLDYAIYHDRYQRTRRRLEGHRARLRGPIRGHHTAGGLAAPSRGAR
jgi:hypothetical protein